MMKQFLQILLLLFVKVSFGQLDSSLLDIEYYDSLECTKHVEHHVLYDFFTIENTSEYDYKLIYYQDTLHGEITDSIVRVQHFKIYYENDFAIVFADKALKFDSLFKSLVITKSRNGNYKNELSNLLKKDSIHNETEFVKTNNWKLKRFYAGRQCIDTKINRLKILGEKGSLDFNLLFNTYIYECDVNNDTETELYIISIQSCMNRMKIYQVNKKEH